MLDLTWWSCIALCRSLLPGWTTLTWETMNIDAFLHRVSSAVSALESLASQISDILVEQVYRPLSDIEEGDSLYDEELATEHVWVCICTCT